MLLVVLERPTLNLPATKSDPTPYQPQAYLESSCFSRTPAYGLCLVLLQLPEVALLRDSDGVPVLFSRSLLLKKGWSPLVGAFPRAKSGP